jgi:hypothetical protein
MRRWPIAVIIASTLFCTSCREDTRNIIPVRFVKRLPNELVYYARTLDASDKLILRSVLESRGTEYYTDKRGNLYIDASTNFGESRKTFFWTITEDFMSAKIKSPKSLQHIR